MPHFLHSQPSNVRKSAFLCFPKACHWPKKRNQTATAKTADYMTELSWEGKYKDGKKTSLVRIALPFQIS